MFYELENISGVFASAIMKEETKISFCHCEGAA